jgi:two-component system CheB/CheR fusion protein
VTNVDRAGKRKIDTPDGAAEKPEAKHRKKNSRSSRVNESRFPIVGIGASAGGLEALQQLFSSMPSDTGMSFVVITHLDPSHESIMPELLGRCTGIPVMTATDGLRVKPDNVYVIPQGKNMGIMDGCLQLLEPTQPHSTGLPIDFFLRSLARDQGNAAVCIILSGTGSDGTLGLKEIKAESGITIVQDPDSAKYNGMPRSAADTGLVDFILPPAKMPEQLAALSRHFKRTGARLKHEDTDRYSNQMQKVFVVLRQHTKHDFTQYKPATLNRRIERRMHVNRMADLADYVNFLQEQPEEAEALFKEILISVTAFFRDPKAFQSLKNCIKNLIQAKTAAETLRIWVPGCATGEEAYSIAILARECMTETDRERPIQIFATDIDSGAITAGRAGVYPVGIAADISPERLKRYFTRSEHNYIIKNEIREMVIFAIQDIVRDPPFSKVDLICCRNLLIYLNSELQAKLLPVFHYSLNRGGILFLGPSETVGQCADLFSCIDKKWKIYERIETLETNHMRLQFPVAAAELEGENKAGTPAARPGEQSVAELAQKVLLNDYAPACVIIDQKHDIIFVHGQTGRYLELADGETSLDVVDMAREGLKAELSAAIRKATVQDQEVTCNNLLVKHNGEFRTVNLTVRPVTPKGSGRALLMVIFQDILPPEPAEGHGIKSARKTKLNTRIEVLEQELKLAKDDHQTTIEELETSNEELKSANEELQSTNEELQSTNEELETSREELQSINEELMTVNTEHQAKIDELSKVTDDLQNLLNSSDIAILFLDTGLCIRRYTPATSALFNLIKSDIGRPISHVTSSIIYTDLEKDLEAVLETLIPKQAEVISRDGHWYTMRILPYRTRENAIGGLVVSFLDIDEQKKAAKASEELAHSEVARIFAESIVNTVREPLLVLDSKLKVISANNSFYRTFKVSQEQVTNQAIFNLGNRQWDIPELRRLLEDILPGNSCLDHFKVDYSFPGLGRRVMLLNARKVEPIIGQKPMILLSMEDITTSGRPKKRLSGNQKPEVKERARDGS